METIQGIIDTIKQWPSTIWWSMGVIFIISWFLIDDKNNKSKGN